MQKKRAIGLLILIAGCLASGAWAAGQSPEATNVSQVWAREEAYWRFVQAGDVDAYLELWHEHFVGWPCSAHTATKASIGNWVRAIRDKKVRFTYVLTREAAQDFGSVVVTYYSTPMVWKYPDGRIEGQDEMHKFTHTWLKVGDSWQIIGGMCGSLEQPAR